MTPATAFIPSAGSDLSLDLGLVVPVVVGDQVWEDLNANGIQDPDEVGLPDVAVILWSAGPDGLVGTTDDLEVATTTTAADGSYLFVGLDPDSYYVQFDLATLPAGYVVTFADQGADDALDSDADAETGITAATGYLNGSGDGTVDLTLDMGAYIPVSIGDLLWEDQNGNGAQDEGEPGVSGVTVTLYAAGPDGLFGTADDVVVAEMLTDDSGGYLFAGLPPGTYVVGFDLGGLPAGAVVTVAGATDAAADSDIDPVTGLTPEIEIEMGVDDLTWDAGFFVPYDLVVAKTLVGPLTSAEEATYQVAVSNIGPGPAYGPISMIDEMPPGLVPVTASGDDAWSCDIAGQTVTCVHAAEMGVGELGIVTIVAQVTATGGETIVNTAAAFGANPEVLGSDLSDDASDASGLVVAQEEDLPRTGQDLDRIAWLALITLILGGLILLFGRRRRPRLG
jgi:uncharacterized repeat protein (TIGR01451 family)/LPXTG-motif cell wall-anchored protein